MLRRSPAVLAALAAALTLAARPSPTRAAGIAADIPFGGSAVLTNTSNQPITDVFALIEPPGKIAQPASNTPADPNAHPLVLGPLTVLDDSSGFDRAGLQFGLAGGSINNEPKQGLGLIFGNGGLQPGGQLHFTLKLDPSYTGDLDLQLVDSLKTLNPLASGTLTLAGMAAPSPDTGGKGNGNDGGSGGGGGTTSPPPTQTPEPLALIVWSAGAAGLVLARARARRRSRPASA